LQSRSYSVESWSLLNESMSRFVIQLAVCKGDRMLPVHFGTGIILCYVPSPSCIAILTTVTCAENREKGEEDDEEKKKDDYKTFVKFGDFEEKKGICFPKRFNPYCISCSYAWWIREEHYTT